MRVLCVNNGIIPNRLGLVRPANELQDGMCYTVIDENEFSYELVEVKSPEGFFGFKKARFIPCSYIDEMEMQKKKELSIANLFKWL